MNWFTENKAFSGVLIIIALGALALGYLTFTAKNGYNAAVESYQTGLQTLTGLRGKSPFRNPANLKKKKEQVVTYKELGAQLRSDLIFRQGDIAAIEPAAFQSRLRDMVSKAISRAAERGVELPKPFYLGFEKYENEPPRNEITGLLNWQLTAIDFVVNRLIDFKVQKITNISRPILPGELVNEPPSKETPLFKKYPFKVEFFGYPNHAQSLLNELASSKQAMIARAVRFENEAQKAPIRGAEVLPPEIVNASAPKTDAELAKTDGNEVRIIIGKERVSTSVIIDLVHFTPEVTPRK